MKRKLVDHLVDAGVVARKDIQRCVLRASLDKEVSVVDELAEDENLDQQRLTEEMAEFWGLEVWNGTPEVDAKRYEFIPEHKLRHYGIIPSVRDGSDRPTVVVYDVEKAGPVIEQIQTATGSEPIVMLTPKQRILGQLEDDQDNGSTDAQQPGNSSADPGHGVMRKNPRSRPKRATTGPGRSSPGQRQPQRPSAKAEPTRQVSLEKDNPFMDLVNQSAGKKSNSKDSEPPSLPTRAVGGEETDFFQEVDKELSDAIAESSAAVEDSEPESVDVQQQADPDEMEGALDDFDQQLAEESESDPEFVADKSEVDWGQYRGEDEPAFPGLEVESGGSHPEQASTMTPNPPSYGDSGASGVFPLEDRSGKGGFFDFPEEDAQDDLTLAQVVERQRKIISKLEREIEYQKGILQTMAELLVEARVLSKRKLKNRLKAFKQEQRKRQQNGD